MQDKDSLYTLTLPLFKLLYKAYFSFGAKLSSAKGLFTLGSGTTPSSAEGNIWGVEDGTWVGRMLHCGSIPKILYKTW